LGKIALGKPGDRITPTASVYVDGVQNTMSAIGAGGDAALIMASPRSAAAGAAHQRFGRASR
jgi:hypothetical protein